MKTLKPHKVDWAQIERFLASADKKLASAHKILAFDEEACRRQPNKPMLKPPLGSMLSNTFRRTLRKSGNLLPVLSATSGGYNSLCFPVLSPASAPCEAQRRARRPAPFELQFLVCARRRCSPSLHRDLRRQVGQLGWQTPRGA